ncbi:hypothetical protein B0H13DRAFT_685093 [Mycena leptocephala]|nr:hypothetical protein B0H13DRAFT_685093 [Mycena leptocephala]
MPMNAYEDRLNLNSMPGTLTFWAYFGLERVASRTALGCVRGERNHRRPNSQWRGVHTKCRWTLTRVGSSYDDLSLTYSRCSPLNLNRHAPALPIKPRVEGQNIGTYVYTIPPPGQRRIHQENGEELENEAAAFTRLTGLALRRLKHQRRTVEGQDIDSNYRAQISEHSDARRTVSRTYRSDRRR